MKIKNKNRRGKRSICTCLNCGEEFSELNFRINAGGGKFCCNECYKEYRKKNKKDEKVLNKLNQKKHKYGISKDEYLNLFIIQDNKCAICGNDITDNACVDHNHKTGKIRGLLCQRCNLLLGLAKDNVEILKKSIIYLENNK